jgi:hypothetical protein
MWFNKAYRLNANLANSLYIWYLSLFFESHMFFVSVLCQNSDKTVATSEFYFDQNCQIPRL